MFDNFESVQNLSPHPSPGKGGESELPLGSSLGKGAGSELSPGSSLGKGAGSELPLPSEGRGLGGEVGFPVADETLAGLFNGLLDAQWRSLCLFTGRYRWQALDEHLGRSTAMEQHLKELTVHQTIMLMDNLPRLRRQPLAAKIAMMHKVGGHPHSIEMLEGWLASGRVSDLLADLSLDGLLREQWEGYFLTALLAQLAPAQRDALARLCIFRINLGDDVLAYAGVDDATVRAWLDLSLVQREQGTPAVDLPPEMAELLALLPEDERRKFEAQVTYSIHPVVREYLLGNMSEEERRDLHLWAAGYHGRPFVEIAWRVADQASGTWTQEEIESFARGRDGVVGQMMHRTDDMAQSRAAMASALEWQYHLFTAATYEPAGQIVTAVHDILARWGQRDRAKTLLRGSIATLEGGNRAVAQGNLASLFIDEGKLDEALALHEVVYATFEALDARQQIAAALAQMGLVYQALGEHKQAIEKYEQTLTIVREDRNTEDEASSLHQLSTLYMLTGADATALARSHEAEALARKLGSEALVVATLNLQGLIYKRLANVAHRAGNDAEAVGHVQQAFDRFQQGLAIAQRIGYEAGAVDSLGELGKLLMDAGQMREAIAAFTEVLDITKRLGNPVKVGIMLAILGTIHERQDQYAAALEKYEQALVLFKRYSHAAHVADTERTIARVRAKMSGA